TLLVSLAPILGLKSVGIAAGSRQVSARASVAQRLAGTVQVAIAGALSGAAVAFGWYVASLMFADPGYKTRDLYTVTFSGISATASRDITSEYVAVEFVRRREAIETLP